MLGKLASESSNRSAPAQKAAAEPGGDAPKD